jgi:hypothetical protein
MVKSDQIKIVPYNEFILHIGGFGCTWKDGKILGRST